MKILRRNVGKEEFKNFLNHIDLTDESLYKEITENQNFVFQFSGNTASRMTREAKPETFDDIICLNSYSRPGASFGFPTFCDIKNHGGKSVYPEQIQQFLKDGRGTICFQEQCMAIGNYLTDGKYNGDTWRRLLKKLGKAKKAPEDLEKWSKMVACAKETGLKKGISNKDIELLCDDLLTLSAYSFNKAHAAAYSYLAMEEIYLAKYFKPYFYAINLSNEAGKKDAIKEAIDSCKKSGFEVEPPNINNSRENFFPKENKLYFGFNDIKGVGEEPAKDIVRNQPYTSIIDFICKNIGTKINKRVTSALIGSGAFDEFIEGNRKYYQQVADKFYEKKKTIKTIPLLEEKWEESLNEVEKCETTETDYIEYEETYLGGQFFHSKFSAIAEKIEKLYSKGYCLRDFDELRRKNLPKQYVFVYVNSYRYYNDKNGREMLFCEIEDRNGEKQSIPIFASFWQYVKLKFYGEAFYLMDLYPTEDGKVMFGSRNWVKDPVTIKNMIARVPV